MRAVVLALLLSLVAAPALGHEDPKDTLARLDARVEAAPDDLDLLLARSELRRARSLLDGALDDADRAVRLAPDDPRGYAERGLARARADRPGALADLDAYLARVDRPRVDVLAARAELLTAAGRPHAAAADLRRAVEARPTPDLCRALGDLLTTLGRPGDAAAAYADCADRLGGATSLRLAAVDAHVAAGRPDAAVEVLDAMLSERPDHPGWRLRRAELQLALGHADAARADLEAGLSAVDRKLEKRRTDQLIALRVRILAELGDR